MYKITCVRTGTWDRPNRQLKGSFERTFESLDDIVDFIFSCKYSLCFPRLNKELNRNDLIVLKRKFAAMKYKG